MKQMKIAGLLLLSLLALSGCAEAEEDVRVELGMTQESESVHAMVKVGVVDNYHIVQDSLTKCLYLKGTYGISPYYDGRGQIAGCTSPEGDIHPSIETEQTASEGEES